MVENVNGETSRNKRPKGIWALVLLILLPVTFTAGVLSAPFLSSSFDRLFSGGGWKQISFKYCVSYDVQSFPVLPEVVLPETTNCSGRFRLLDYGSRDIGYEIDIAIPSSPPENIPPAWRKDQRIDGSRWKLEGRTEVSFDGVLQFSFLDSDGFEVASLRSEPVTIESGKISHFSGRLAAPPLEEAKAIAMAEGFLSLTSCQLCTAP